MPLKPFDFLENSLRVGAVGHAMWDSMPTELSNLANRWEKDSGF
jgi:hypothetical protein